MRLAFSLGTKRRRLTARDGSELVSDAMPRSLDRAFVSVEDKRLESLPDSAKQGVKKLECSPLERAKVRAGRAVRHAIGESPMKEYGDEGQMSKVVAGPGIPDYLARIVNRPDALRRYALSLLEGEQGVEVETTVRIRRRA
jgi:hypothetical protein